MIQIKKTITEILKITTILKNHNIKLDKQKEEHLQLLQGIHCICTSSFCLCNISSVRTIFRDKKNYYLKYLLSQYYSSSNNNDYKK